MEGPPGSGLPRQELLFDLRIGPLVGAFLLLAALDHALVALPPCRARYERGLGAGVNPFRWLEYSLSASLMVKAPPVVSGASDSLSSTVSDDICAASLVPWIVTVTDCVVPSIVRTVKLSLSVSPTLRAWTALLSSATV